jgi:hypothetical protein
MPYDFWWSQPPPNPTSEFDTLGDIRRAQVLQATGYDIAYPGRGLAQMLATYLPMVMPGASRIGGNVGWAASAPDASIGPWAGYINTMARQYRPGMDMPSSMYTTLGNIPRDLGYAGNANFPGVTLPPLLRVFPGGR